MTSPAPEALKALADLIEKTVAQQKADNWPVTLSLNDERVNQIVTALRTAATGGEVVAWQWRYAVDGAPWRTPSGGEKVISEENIEHRPLYASPPPAAIAGREWNEAIEAAAKLVEPKLERPCDCDNCYCGNSDDTAAVAAWDADAYNAKAIRALIRALTRSAPDAVEERSGNGVEEDGDEVFVPINDVRCCGEGLKQIDGFWRCPKCESSFGPSQKLQDVWKLMPPEATREMTMAGCDCLPSCEHVFGHAGELLSNAYREMFAAAPASPSVGPSDPTAKPAAPLVSEEVRLADPSGLASRYQDQVSKNDPAYGRGLPSGEEIARIIEDKCSLAAYSPDEERAQLREAARAILALLQSSPLAQPSDAGWWTIDSAPKDETPILLGKTGLTPLVGYSGPYRRDWWLPHSAGKVWFEPTHWRPLPAPPTHQPAPEPAQGDVERGQR